MTGPSEANGQPEDAPGPMPMPADGMAAQIQLGVTRREQRRQAYVAAALNGKKPPRPPKPGLDSIVAMITYNFEFARDMGGELFLLPGRTLTGEPYIPRSFHTSDVMNLGHITWRWMAERWNAWVASLEDAERKRLEVSELSPTPSDTLIRNAVAHLQALGMTKGRKVSAALRSVQLDDGSVVIDLGDDTGRVVHCTPGGWLVRDPRELPCGPPVFRRSVGYFPLPEPVHGGSLDELWHILRISSGKARSLAGGWLVAAYLADVPRPGLWFTGPAGAGKSTMGGALARLTDGLEWLDGKMDRKDERNNIIRAAKCFVPSFDNMTGVTADQSDWICQLVTGHRDMFRRMRTNFDDVSLAYRRTFVATGLSLPYGLQPDALDRIIEVPVGQLDSSQRLPDEVMRRELDAARPRLLGAVLDHLCMVLARLPRIPGSWPGMPRMASYARALAAHDDASGTDYYGAFVDSAQQVRADKSDGDPVVQAMLSWMQPGGQWAGTATELFGYLSGHRTADGSDWWPGNSRALSAYINKVHGLLVSAGFQVERSPVKDDRRIWVCRLQARS